MPKSPKALIILDGFAFRDETFGNAVAQANKPNFDRYWNAYPHATLTACGEAVGLPEGQMGNSEVGHLNIGAGRIVYQSLTRIHKSIREGDFFRNEQFLKAVEHAKANGGKLHFMGLLSDGGVHSHYEHLFALLKLAKEHGVQEVYVHGFLDGRDVGPTTALGYIEETEKQMQEIGVGKFASIHGRYYAMDRDKRWERVKVAYDQLVNGEGKQVTDMVAAVADSYAEGVTDEFMKPIVNSAYDSRIEEGDVVIFFNFRNDRAKELTIVLTQKDLTEEGMKTIPGLQYYCLTPYDASFTGVHILFDKENVNNTLGEYLSSKGLSQLHIAETEKYAHVTFFLNGGRETPYEGEERILVPSPKVATYDLQPEMSAYLVRDRLVEAINSDKFDFIVVNFANGDMVGHTGVYEAIEKAVVAVDACVRDVIEAAKAHNYESIIIADHGNADNAVNADGSPNTAHSLNPVPIIYVTSREGASVEDGILADVAPSILSIMGLEIPAEMTGKVLVK